MPKKQPEAAKTQTIQAQILKGYLILTAIIAALVIIAISLLWLTEKSYGHITQFQGQQYAASKVISAHYQWLEQLSDAITTGSDFQGSLDPDDCALGHWINSSEDDLAKYPEIKKALDDIIAPHREIHLEAKELVAQSRIDKDEAYRQYSSVFKPKVENIGAGLSTISSRYQFLAAEIQRSTARTTWIFNILLVLIGVLSLILSLAIGRRVARRIAAPILTVAKWSEEFATGVDNLNMDDAFINDERNSVEIKRMMQSFKMLAESIRDNVRIIQKVAAGDLTAYVDIKSSGDSLGRNLYHLVQNNDFMFSNLLRIADEVAQSADHIAIASQDLAESSIMQASAVETLSGTMDQANELALANAQNACQSGAVITDMQQDVAIGQEKMADLCSAVDKIQSASGNISKVLKSINDIAFQTNILALNASVEAAQAGSAGKGFAVVANEVRTLALKSAEAAEQSRAFIEDTIAKADYGSVISREASQTFAAIVDIAGKVTAIMEGIQAASDQQQHHIAKIRQDIQEISSSVSRNAATSEEIAASTNEMTENADVIHTEMQRFNLRKRQEGRPYIPPEKANDTEFIRQAEENYHRALKAPQRR